MKMLSNPLCLKIGFLGILAVATLIYSAIYAYLYSGRPPWEIEANLDLPFPMI